MDGDPWLLPLSSLTVVVALVLAALDGVWWPLLGVTVGAVLLWRESRQQGGAD